jgi:hypothetical protein
MGDVGRKQKFPHGIQRWAVECCVYSRYVGKMYVVSAYFSFFSSVHWIKSDHRRQIATKRVLRQLIRVFSAQRRYHHHQQLSKTDPQPVPQVKPQPAPLVKPQFKPQVVIIHFASSAKNPRLHVLRTWNVQN